MMLRRRLRKRGIAFQEVNIKHDAAARALVRAAAGGDETVPTVEINDSWLVNPSIDEVVAAVARVPRSTP